MKFSIAQPELLNIVSAAGVLVDEATLDVSETSLSFRGMDPSHIAMVDINWPIQSDSALKLGVRVTELAKVVKRFDKKDMVEVSEKDSMLTLSNGTKTYKHTLIESSGGDTPMPKLTFEVKAEMERATLDQIFADISAIGSEKITIDGGVYFVGSSDAGEAKITSGVAATGQGTATYSLDYLTKMVKAVQSDKVTLEYSTKMPIKLSMLEGKVAYYLAPRVQE